LDTLLLALIAVVVFVVGLALLILGGIAFWRTHRLGGALESALARIEELEETVIRLNAQTSRPNWVNAERPAAAAEAVSSVRVEERVRESVTRVPDPAAAPIDHSAPPPEPPLRTLGPAPAAVEAASGSPRPGPAPEAAPGAASPELSAAAKSGAWIGRRFSGRVDLGWLAIAGLGLAIVALLGFGVSRGWIDETVQFALALVAGLGLIGSAEWTRRTAPADVGADGDLRLLPGLLASVGLLIVFAAGWMAHNVWRGSVGLPVLEAPAALIFLIAAGGAGLALSLRFGPWLAALGLTGGFIAPMAVEVGAPAPTALFLYLAGLTGMALAIVRFKRWPALIWLAAGGALFWGALWAYRYPAMTNGELPAGLYLVAIAALGVAFAWDDARAPLSLTRPWKDARWSENVAAGYVMAAGAGLVLLYFVIRTLHPPGPVLAMSLLGAVLVIAAIFREGFAGLPLIGAGLSAGLLWTWPIYAAPSPDVAAAMMPPFFTTAGVFGFTFSIGGWWMMIRNAIKGPGATLAALAPVLILFAAFARGEEAVPPWIWVAAACGVAAINALMLQRLAAESGGLDKTPGPSAAFALGAIAAAALAAETAVSGLWAGVGLALLLPAIAWAERRIDLPALRLGAALLGGYALWKLTISMEPLGFRVAGLPILNELLAGYAIAILAFAFAARLFDRTKGRDDTRLVQALEAGALILTATLLSLQVRHLANAGNLSAPYLGIGEMGGHTLAWLALALGLAWRFGGRPRPLLYWAEAAAFFGALVHVLVVGVLVLNPWWGNAPSPAPGMPILNTLLPAFALPAALLAVYALLRRGQGMIDRSNIAAAAAIALGLLAITMEVRRAFQGAEMDAGPVTPREAFTATFIWVVYGAALYLAGAMRKRATLLIGAVAVLALAATKLFVLDLAGVGPVWRFLCFVGLGATLIGLGVVFQRYVFPKPLTIRGIGHGDPNIIPPADGARP
jgi:uncharacterized membrane protein